MHKQKKCHICKQEIKENGCYVGQGTFAKIVHSDKCYDKLIKEICAKVKKERKKATKKLSEKELTQRVVNKFVRLRDTRPDGIGYCISCGCTLEYGTQNCQAGHYKSVGSRNDLRFNPDNIHIQCLKCNKYGERDVWIQYRDNLCRKIGIHKVHELEDKSLIEKQDHSDDKLKEIRQHFQAEIKKLEAVDNSY